MSVRNMLTNIVRSGTASNAPPQEHPLLTMVGLLATAFSSASAHYRPFTATQWHPIYENQRLSPEKRRLLREAELPNEWTPQVWNEAKAFWNFSCAACGRKTQRLERDHIVPLADRRCPGATVENLIPLCKGCNIDKGANDLALWHHQNFGSIKRTEKLLDRVAAWQDYAAQHFPPQTRKGLREIAKTQYTQVQRTRRSKRRR